MPPLPSLQSIIPILQTAIGPVILISGVGLLLLSMTNRLGRVIDRSRILVAELRKAGREDRLRLQPQLDILTRRAALIQRAILFASVSVLLAALLVILLFALALLRWDDAWGVSLLFTACMVCLILSLAAFIKDINLSLLALKRELGEVEGVAGEQ